MRSEATRIAIVGMGGVFPASPRPADLWGHVLRAADTCREVPPGRWLLEPDDAYRPGGPSPDRVYCRRGCFIEDFTFDPAGLDLPADLMAGLDPVFHLTLHAGRQAWRSAKTDTLDRQRISIILGNIALPTEKASALARAYLGRTFAEKVLGPGAGPGVEVAPLNRGVAALPAGLLARGLGLGGGCYTLDAACASSLYALKLAMDELRAERVDAVLAGGVSRPDCLYTQMGFSQLRALSPSGRCAPFDARGDGLIVGEGAGVFLLKRLDDALRDGDEILTVLVAAGVSNDVGGSLLAPSSEGQLRAMRTAYQTAGWSPHEVDLVECHATGTPVGDAVEYQSLRTLWGDQGWRPGQCVLGSVKSTVGHLLTAAGAAGLTKVIFALRTGTLPPTANFATPHQGLDFDRSPFRVLTEPAPWVRRDGRPRRAALSAFGFGGINAHVLVEEGTMDCKLQIADCRLQIPQEGLKETASSPTPGTNLQFAICNLQSPVAVIGLDARFGPWTSLASLRERVLGGGEPVEPQPPRRWWGVPESAWFRGQGWTADAFAGFYLEAVTLDAGRFRIPPRELEEMLPQQLLILQVADALLGRRVVPEATRLRTGVYLGIGLDLNTTNFHFRWSLLPEARGWASRAGLTEPELDRWVQGLREAAGPPLTANRTMGALASIAASRVAREFHLGGPSFTVAGEETSGLRALEVAVRAVQRGEIDQAFVGAVDLAGDVRSVLSLDQERPFSRRGQSRPFDQSAAGPVVGEGAAGVLLKRLDHALRDGDRVLAVIQGIGTGGGDQGYRLALERAFEEAGIVPGSIDLVATHGSGDPTEDAPEAHELVAFYGADRDTPLTLSSAQADLGHTGAAAGLASFVKACLCLQYRVQPGLRNLVQPQAELREVLDRFALLREPRPWLRDRADGPFRAGVSAIGRDGTCMHVILEAADADRVSGTPPPRPCRETLFAIEGEEVLDLLDGLARLHSRLADRAPVSELARVWRRERPLRPQASRALALVARERQELIELVDLAQRSLLEAPERPLPSGVPALRDRVFYAPSPLGQTGRLVFVFPGSGNDYPGMGRDLAVQWPEVLYRQNAENVRLRSQFVPERTWRETGEPGTPRERIFSQVTLAGLVCDLLANFGVRPSAALGYSLGESAALFALRAWSDRDEMLQRMNASPLFATELSGPCDAARRAWGLPAGKPVAWLSGVIDRSPDAVQAALAGVPRVYLQIVNTPRECVLGGEKSGVEAVVRRLGGRFVPIADANAVHCAVVRAVAEAYRALHVLPTTPAAGIRFYSAALGKAYELTVDTAAEAILAQALDTVDFPAVVEAAYADGARLFVEIGPGGSCTRMIGAILNDRPHRSRAVCVPGSDGVTSVLRLLAWLLAERVPARLDRLDEAATEGESPPIRALVVPVGGQSFAPPALAKVSRERQLPEAPPGADAPSPVPADTPLSVVGFGSETAILHRIADVQQARAEAHSAFLRLAGSLGRTFTETVTIQTEVLEALVRRGAVASTGGPMSSVHPDIRGPVSLSRAQCLEFAAGSIAAVLGPDFAAVDALPTRVRLPDEPLMLVDRILAVTGEPRSLGAGRVLTEHDIHAGAWYLDAGRIPTCIAVEAGQADLFLSGYLGIDFQTRGLAVYRLLDAMVTFHRGLPGPGEVIHYDIHIDRFFRQGDTHLFRFRFEGTVNGEPLLTMKNGCAGFFTAAELAAGRGIVQTELDRRPMEGKRPEERLVPATVESYDDRQIDALRTGDLAGCFGPMFAGLDLHAPLRIPGGRMRLVDRVLHLDPNGGRFGIGLIRAEHDIRPDAWFLTCHFVDDPVMPGTLMYECCLHTLRIFLLRRGWVGEQAGIACEPVPGVASGLRCRGQVTASTRKVQYEVTLKELGYRPEPYAVVDALMHADGKPIVEITDMSLRMTGLDRAQLHRLWEQKQQQREPAGPPASPVFNRQRIVAFSIGKPSEAFGEPYRLFDEERVIARLPGPPYLFLDRITYIDAKPWQVVAGGVVEAEYDVSQNEWYFAADRQNAMPFAVLLEVALQPCGWLAAYLGSALTSPVDLSFRNLGGNAELLEPVGRDAGTLTTRVKITRVASSGGMIIQRYDFAIRRGSKVVYRGDTTFGFFSRAALAEQVGLRDATPYQPTNAERARGRSFPVPRDAPFPDDRWRMVDRVDLFVPDGGPHGLGLILGSTPVDPAAWFFKAHFYQDPVWPGSLGLESLLQLMKVAARERWPDAQQFHSMLGPTHHWLYRGQVIPSNRRVDIQAVITGCDPAAQRLTGDGHLTVDGRVIYQMKSFTVEVAGKRRSEAGR